MKGLSNDSSDQKEPTQDRNTVSGPPDQSGDAVVSAYWSGDAAAARKNRQIQARRQIIAAL